MRSTTTNSLAVAGIGMAALLVGCSAPGSTASPQAPASSSASFGGAVATATPAGNGGTGSTPGSGTGPGASPSSTALAGGGAGANGASGGAGGNGPGGLAILGCPTSGLKVAEGTGGAAAGSVYLPLEFTNTSGRTCTLFGYPGVALTTSMAPGSQVGAAATRSTGRPKLVVTLAPGAIASAMLQIAQVAAYPSSTCDPVSARYLQVYPPGQTAAVYLPFTGQGCVKRVFVLGISAIQSGTGA